MFNDVIEWERYGSSLPETLKELQEYFNNPIRLIKLNIHDPSKILEEAWWKIQALEELFARFSSNTNGKSEEEKRLLEVERQRLETNKKQSWIKRATKSLVLRVGSWAVEWAQEVASKAISDVKEVISKIDKFDVSKVREIHDAYQKSLKSLANLFPELLKISKDNESSIWNFRREIMHFENLLSDGNFSEFHIRIWMHIQQLRTSLQVIEFNQKGLNDQIWALRLSAHLLQQRYLPTVHAIASWIVQAWASEIIQRAVNTWDAARILVWWVLVVATESTNRALEDSIALAWWSFISGDDLNKIKASMERRSQIIGWSFNTITSATDNLALILDDITQIWISFEEVLQNQRLIS